MSKSKRFLTRLALAFALLISGDYFNFIAITKQALHVTGQALADSTQTTKLAKGG